ncbi:MAG: hypothetical protein ACRCUJ_01625 [Phocaeicola sp.]
MSKKEVTHPETFSKNAIGLQQLIEMQYDVFEFEDEWEAAFGHPERKGVWMIWGNSGNGKSRFALMLCKYLSQFGVVAYNSLEEGASLSIRNAILEVGFKPKNKNFKLLANEPINELSIRMKKQRAPDIVVIDSFQYTQMNYRQYISFKEAHPNKLIIFISHADGKLPSGRSARSLMYDASLKIYVEGFRAFSKGRFKGELGYYDIWAEKAESFHGIKNDTTNENS